jgi:hypothetical protein
VIAETGSSTDTINCGVTTTPAGFNSCISGFVTKASTSPPFAPAFVSPNPSNTIHVALAPGITFAPIAAISPVITVTATYTRDPMLGPAVTLTTNTATIGVVPPLYQMTVSASPTTISSATSSGTGATITATIQHPSPVGCIPLAFGGFIVCAGSPTLFSFGVTQGAEPGLVTFKTTAGALTSSTDTSGTATQLQVTVHCGPIPTTPPTVIVPAGGIPPVPSTQTLSFSSCSTASATLVGAGAGGTALITASFVGDTTGASANATTQVTLTGPPSGAATPLTVGCNEVVLPSTLPGGTAIGVIVNDVQPAGSVVSIWAFNNATHLFLGGYFNTPGAPVDFTTVSPSQSVFICVNAAATFVSPGS